MSHIGMRLFCVHYWWFVHPNMYSDMASAKCRNGFLGTDRTGGSVDMWPQCHHFSSFSSCSMRPVIWFGRQRAFPLHLSSSETEMIQAIVYKRRVILSTIKPSNKKSEGSISFPLSVIFFNSKAKNSIKETKSITNEFSFSRREQ